MLYTVARARWGVGHTSDFTLIRPPRAPARAVMPEVTPPPGEIRSCDARGLGPEVTPLTSRIVSRTVWKIQLGVQDYKCARGSAVTPRGRGVLGVCRQPRHGTVRAVSTALRRSRRYRSRPPTLRRSREHFALDE